MYNAKSSVVKHLMCVSEKPFFTLIMMMIMMMMIIIIIIIFFSSERVRFRNSGSRVPFLLSHKHAAALVQCIHALHNTTEHGIA